MTIAQEITEKLKNSLSFRERRFRESYLLEMVLAKNGITDALVPMEKLGKVIKDYMSYERIWRDVLSDPLNAHLRGEDWSDGKILDQKYQINVLGREPGYKVFSESETHEMFG